MATAVGNNRNTGLSRRDEGFRTLSGLLQSDGMKHKLKLALPKHLTPDRMIRIALSAASRQPLLLECSPESIALSLVRAAEFGVETDGWDAHLVPYKNKGKLECQLIVDYKGLCKLAYQSELVLEIQAGAVFEKDIFEYEMGSDSFLRHIPTDEEDPGALRFAWAMAKIKGGGAPFVVLNKRQVMEHKKASTASNSDYSPWNKAATEPSMWKKTALRELAKTIPRSATLHAAMKHEDASDIGGKVIDGVVMGPDDEQESKSDTTAKRLGAKNASDEVEGELTQTTDESQVENSASETESSQDPGEIAADDEDAMLALNAKLDLCANLTSVNEVEKAAIAAGLDEKQVRTMCDARRDEIRDARGK